MSDGAKAAFSNPLADKLRAGGIGLALMVKQARTVDIVLAAKTCGFDAVYMDLQHSTMSADTAAQISVAALGAGVTTLVRIPKADYNLALSLLDAGTLGIIVPDVVTAADAREAVQHCKFAPLGARSTGASWPQFGYASVPVAEAQGALNANTLLICMIESQAALNNVEEIAAVSGIDVLHVGSGDLATDLGVPGQLQHPSVIAAIERVTKACRQNGKFAGVGGLSGGRDSDFNILAKMGIQFLSAANEWSLMISAGRERVRHLRQALGGGTASA